VINGGPGVYPPGIRPRLCDLNGHFPKGLKVHIDEYEVPNKPSLALLFRQFDDRKSNRSPSDVASAYQGLSDASRL